MKKEDVTKILDEHELWLKTRGAEGKCADLSNMDLAGCDLSGRDLSFAIVWGTNFEKCHLKNAKIEYMNVDEYTKFGNGIIKPKVTPAKFWSDEGRAMRTLQKPTKTLEWMLNNHELWLKTKGKEGERLNVSGMRLSDTDFSGRDMRFIIASNTGFQRCNFEGANLGGSNLRFAKMFYSNLKDTVLVGTDLYASFSRWVNFSNSIMRESDVRNFHDQLMGTNKTISHAIAIISGTVSIVSLVPAALEVLPINPALAPVLGLSVWTALNYRFVMEYAMGGWYFRPIKNMKEVLFNIEISKIEENEKLLAECVEGNPVLMAENMSIKTVEQFKKQKAIDAERIMNYEFEKHNKSKVDGIMGHFRSKNSKDEEKQDDVDIQQENLVQEEQEARGRI